jgi:hypothetical protein
MVNVSLSLEHEDEAIDQLIADLQTAERALTDRTPADLAPRLGEDANPGRRAYIDHSRSIGAFNPCFPEYRIEVRGEKAAGTVSFPIAYEGPPGVVHGGFLALFFDCAIQHHNCDLGMAGKTTSLNITYQRPAPIDRTLAFEIQRTVAARRITSLGELSFNGATLCSVTMDAVAGDRARLPHVSPRRSES